MTPEQRLLRSLVAYTVVAVTLTAVCALAAGAMAGATNSEELEAPQTVVILAWAAASALLVWVGVQWTIYLYNRKGKR